MADRNPWGPPTCAVCGQVGVKRFGWSRFGHDWNQDDSVGPRAHSFVADEQSTLADDQRADPAYRDRMWFERTHRAEGRYNESIGANDVERQQEREREWDRQERGRIGPW